MPGGGSLREYGYSYPNTSERFRSAALLATTNHRVAPRAWRSFLAAAMRWMMYPPPSALWLAHHIRETKTRNFTKSESQLQPPPGTNARVLAVNSGEVASLALSSAMPPT